MENGVRHLSAGCVGNLEFDLERYLSFNSVRNLRDDFIWLKIFDLIWLRYIISLGNLVWYLAGLNVWDLLCDLVFLSHVFSHVVDMSVIR